MAIFVYSVASSDEVSVTRISVSVCLMQHLSEPQGSVGWVNGLITVLISQYIL